MEPIQKDLISNLPDEILYKITSFLPFESLLLTSFLSTKWRKFWSEISVQNGALEHLANAASKFLIHDFNPIFNHPRRLQYQFGNGKALLISVVANEKLHLHFSSEKQQLPTQFSWKLTLNYDLHPSHHSFFFVKTLCLKSVSGLTTEAVSSLVSSIYSLESLKIIECNGLQSFSITSGSNLHSLAILDCLQLEFLHIGCEKLRSLQYRGWFPRIRIRDHFKMDDVMLDCRQGPGYMYKSSEFDPILLTFKNVTKLTLCKWTFEALIFPFLSWHFTFYKLKELWWIDDSKENFNLNALIAFIRVCPSLERLFVTFDPDSYRILKRSDAFSNNYTKRDVELEELKAMILKGFASQEDEISSEKQLRIAESDGSNFLQRFILVPFQLNSQKRTEKIIKFFRD